jgi:hypothetical protein
MQAAGVALFGSRQGSLEDSQLLADERLRRNRALSHEAYG